MSSPGPSCTRGPSTPADSDTGIDSDVRERQVQSLSAGLEGLEVAHRVEAEEPPANEGPIQTFIRQQEAAGRLLEVERHSGFMNE